jgi:hypothetical protein
LQILNRNIHDEKFNQKSEYFEQGSQVVVDIFPNLHTDNSVALIPIPNTVGKAGRPDPDKLLKRCDREEGAKMESGAGLACGWLKRCPSSGALIELQHRTESTSTFRWRRFENRH